MLEAQASLDFQEQHEQPEQHELKASDRLRGWGYIGEDGKFHAHTWLDAHVLRVVTPIPSMLAGNTPVVVLLARQGGERYLLTSEQWAVQHERLVQKADRKARR